MNSLKLPEIFEKTYIKGIIFVILGILAFLLWGVVKEIALFIAFGSLAGFLVFVIDFIHNVSMSRILRMSEKDPKEAINILNNMISVAKRKAEVARRKSSDEREVKRNKYDNRVIQYKRLIKLIQEQITT